MKTFAKVSLLALVLSAGWLGSSHAATVYVRVGNQPPPPLRYERPWQQPYRSAVWIPGHYDWNRGRYVWVSGYYAYPPRPNARWIAPRYTHAPNGYYYRPGFWN